MCETTNNHFNRWWDSWPCIVKSGDTPSLLELGYDVHYIGSEQGIEKELIGEAFPDVPFYGIASGKLRRYFSMKNFTDPFKVLAGMMQAFRIIKK